MLKAEKTKVNVLCQCGWGLYGVEEEKIPSECPICGYLFGMNEDIDYEKEEE